MSRVSRRKEHEGPIWGRPAPGSRKPAYTREQIAETAIAIADADGFEAVSMRRIATELGAGTMTLYHYVGSKDELVSLISDAIMSEIVIPDDELPEGWREGMAEIARRTLAIFQRHPWIVEHLDEGDPSSTGPSVLHALRNYHGAQFGAEGDPASRIDAMVGYLTAQLGTGDYPHLQAIAGDDPAAGFARIGHLASDEQRFERGLQRVLDGLELWVEREAGAETGS